LINSVLDLISAYS
jgi:Reverse transcriptase (RNA-dependent DNA polymerase)